MEDKKTAELHRWAREEMDFRTADWASVPDIGLYMDQITGYLGRLLAPLGGEVTANMVNNYVKTGHLRRPEKKKYAKDQIAVLYMLCSLKQALSLGDSAALLAALSPDGDIGALYGSFASAQEEKTNTAAEKVEKAAGTEDERALWQLALSLSLDACASRLAAEKLIAILSEKEKTESGSAPERKAQRAPKKREPEKEEPAPEKGQKK